MKPVKITGDTCYVPGITNVMIYKDVMVDPSNNENIDWDNIDGFGSAFITHGHTDHFWNGAKLRSKGTKIYAPRDERGFIENTELNTNGIFCWAKPPDSMLPWFFKGNPCPVDGTIESLEDMPLKAVPLPGHTQWQVGYMTPDGVLMVSDAVVTEKIWETKRMVYYTSPMLARDTLEYIMDSDAEWILPSHGELMSKDDAIELCEVNLHGIRSIEKAVVEVLGRGESSTEDMVYGVAMKLKVRNDFSMHLIAETTVRSFLHMLYNRGVVDYRLIDHKVLWKMK